MSDCDLYDVRHEAFVLYNPAKRIFDDIYERVCLCPETQDNIIAHVLLNYGSKQDIIMMDTMNNDFIVNFVPNEYDYSDDSYVSLIDKHTSYTNENLTYIFHTDEIVNQFHKVLSKHTKRISTGFFAGWILKVRPTSKFIVFAKGVQILLSKP